MYTVTLTNRFQCFLNVFHLISQARLIFYVGAGRAKIESGDLVSTDQHQHPTRKFSKTTRELDATTRTCLEELMTHDGRESLHCMPNHSSKVLERVIARDNHKTLEQI